jgi:hypothetical protein
MAMIKIDGLEYDYEALPEAAKQQLQSMQFVDNELARLAAQSAVLQTARMAYSIALIQAINPNGKPANAVETLAAFMAEGSLKF